MAESLNSSNNSALFRVAVSALVFKEGRVLLSLRRDIDWWNLPGGGVEIDETVDEAVCREVLEETGLEVAVDGIVGVYSKPQKREVVLTFLCHIVGGMLISTEETRMSAYFAPNELPANTLPKHRERVEDALLGQSSTIIRAQRRSTVDDQQLV